MMRQGPAVRDPVLERSLGTPTSAGHTPTAEAIRVAEERADLLVDFFEPARRGVAETVLARHEEKGSVEVILERLHARLVVGVMIWNTLAPSRPDAARVVPILRRILEESGEDDMVKLVDELVERRRGAFACHDFLVGDFELTVDPLKLTIDVAFATERAPPAG